MAKKKKRSSESSKSRFPIELVGILLIIIGVIGFLGYKANILGTAFKGFAMFLMGTFDFIFLSILIIIGSYMLIKRKKPKFLSARFIGLIIFIVGLLALAHMNYLGDKPTIDGTLKETINEFSKCIKDKIAFNGGGVIGALTISSFYVLLGEVGSIIVISVLMLIGLILFSNISFSDIFQTIKDKIANRKSNDDDDENDDEYYDEEEEEEHEENKVKVSSLSELTNTKEKEMEYEAAIKESSNNQKPASNLYANYQFPSITLLDAAKKTNRKDDEVEIKKNIGILEQVLKDFEVFAKVVEVHVGPSVTQYELEIKSGTRTSKITSIHSEIALALAAKDVRIQAPIPGKSTVGIEIPNKVNSMVAFREIISSFPKEKQSNKLMVALGKDIMGTPRYCEINKTPHLLVAGATGSGKSVCINCILASILMRARPDEVKLIMVDPKKVELGMYNGIPHLLQPVVTDPKKASIALQRVVAEMMDRYDKFEDSHTKNIESYNAYLEKKNQSLPEESKLPLLPYIVVIIDELADLMVVAKNEVEDSIMRITQMARAAGIHLIVATQRPSTNVITGVIKANIPSRISFAVSSQIDSRTILDMGGAEKLLGKGDMLFLPMGESIPQRIQGAFVSEEEIQKLVNFVCDQHMASYDDKFNLDTSSSTHSDIDKDDVDNDDPLYNEVVEFVVSTGKASASLIQRRFKVGYNRAARLVDELEERGIVGPQQGSKPREVLVELESDNE
ncbi:MAG: DNA translocase FtsK 4TM domain-containing protein [Bacilli bacterium]|nr:DNA translocase FtsK 4TM domain-containing protein [Bacilli bacterium]